MFVHLPILNFFHALYNSHWEKTLHMSDLFNEHILIPWYPPDQQRWFQDIQLATCPTQHHCVMANKRSDFERHWYLLCAMNATRGWENGEWHCISICSSINFCKTSLRNYGIFLVFQHLELPLPDTAGCIGHFVAALQKCCCNYLVSVNYQQVDGDC